MEHISELIRFAATVAAQERKEKEERTRQGDEFNVFLLCKVNHYENLHSFILSELLNPKGDHGQDSLFLDILLKTVDKDFADSFASKKASVYTEYSMDWGRLDILIEDNAGKGIIIENKIFAQDQDSQICRYDKFASSRYKEENYRIYYLTPDGHEAEKHSGDGVRYTCLSYQESILKWLVQCIEVVSDKPALREPLIQYKQLIEQLVGQDMEKSVNQRLLNEMLNAPNGVASIIRAYPYWEKSIIEKHIIKPLADFANQNGFKFFVNDDFWAKKSSGFIDFRIDDIHSIRLSCANKWLRFYYGVQDSSMNQAASAPLFGLTGGNVWWPYGWHYFDIHSNWEAEDLAIISCDNGEFVEYIKGSVVSLLNEMKRAGII